MNLKSKKTKITILLILLVLSSQIESVSFAINRWYFGLNDSDQTKFWLINVLFSILDQLYLAITAIVQILAIPAILIWAIIYSKKHQTKNLEQKTINLPRADIDTQNTENKFSWHLIIFLVPQIFPLIMILYYLIATNLSSEDMYGFGLAMLPFTALGSIGSLFYALIWIWAAPLTYFLYTRKKLKTKLQKRLAILSFFLPILMFILFASVYKA